MATTLLTWLVALSGIALVPLTISSITASHRLFSYLRAHHHDLWVTLGEPTTWGGRQTFSSPAVRYFTTRQYLGSTDPELRRKSNRARTLLYAAAANFLTFLLSALAFDAVGA
jgi:hypothetical protein